ncbi:DUF5994 family protein [Actinomadura rubrisoli]|uniref:Uncharacterized protein n=1 Tax=Actinomadura rubrisoli TaxID=2530368 RepID=A0A4R5BU42_9ACTN|nr:DUF5994 family protein [Actinomadura rubrisoli]TDD87694.1 hypothetical protein E1298_15820 [Actinomadura rubrisoli]
MWTITERRTTISLSPPSTPRLRLRPAASPGAARTVLDGAWWPRSADPSAELPGLILALQDHGPIDDHRPVTHVLLRVDDWESRPRRLRIDGPADTRVVRLSWFDSLPAGLLTAIHADGRRVDLFTVPVSTTHAEAETAMELASQPANHLHTPDLLAALTTPPGRADRAGTQNDSEDAWESEGGRLREDLATRWSGPAARPAHHQITRDRRSP